MSRWVVKGLQTGIVTTGYPGQAEHAPGTSPGLPKSMDCDAAVAQAASLGCPTAALQQTPGRLLVTREKCVHCFRCSRDVTSSIDWETGFEWATLRPDAASLPKTFQHSMHICIVDAGDCGACLNEVKLLNNPYYNIHRLGFFITPTPRKADILLVVGPVTDHMQTALVKTYEAMPAPRRVMAVGACALSGGVFGPAFVTGSGVGEMFPVDVKVPGCPPPPLAILHGLLVLAGRKTAARATASVQLMKNAGSGKNVGSGKNAGSGENAGSGVL